MVLHYIKYLYRIIINYWYKAPILNYQLPFAIIDDDPEFIKFKTDDVELNKIIFALNNIPDIVHGLLFNKKDNSDVCQKYFSITIKLENSKIAELYHNLDNINEFLANDNIRFIYIRLNILTNSTGKMHHVNCIIIDKKSKYVLFFEPRNSLLFDVNELIDKIKDKIDIDPYTKLIPSDIGYNMFNKLQQYDAFCQTYVLFAYILVINNKDIQYTNYSTMFNSVITSQNIGHFYYHINKLLKINNYNICDQPIVWKFPTNIFNIMHPFGNNNTEGDEVEMSDIVVHEEDEFLIIENHN